jgi:hypothetical protein
MEGWLRMFVEWPNGSRLPVRLPSDATGDDLLHLLRFAFRQNQTILLLVNGACLQPTRELSRQRVPQDAIVRVVNFSEFQSDVSDDEESDHGSGGDFGNAYNEILKIRDLQYRHIEGCAKGGALYRALLAETSEDDESEAEPIPTVLAPTPPQIITDPLPTLTPPWGCTAGSRSAYGAAAKWNW